MKKILTTLFSGFVAFCNIAHAEMEIVITGGLDDARPVAIVPFTFRGLANAQGQMSSAPHDIADIIANDLQRSGKFRPLAIEEMPEKPENANGVHPLAWRSKGVEAVVTGRVIETSAGQYQVAYELIDVVNDKPANATVELSAWNAGVLEAKQHLVQAAGYRMHAHRVADRVYEKLTGERGAFATYISYVNVDRNDRQPFKLFVADSDDYNPRVVLSSKEPIMSPAWANDARRLAYVSFEKNRAQVFVQDIYSGQRQSVAEFPGINGAPSWSPDGKKLALTLSHEGHPEIYVYDLNTRSTQRVTKTSPSTINTEASFSPDGQWLVYTSDRGGKPQIYRMHLPTGQEKRLTFEGDYNAGASYTPDGKKLVLVNRSQGVFHIALYDIQSGVLQVLTDTQLDQSPSLSPNGSMIIYATLFRGQQVLAAVSADGRFKARLQARKGEVRAPAWSPFLD